MDRMPESLFVYSCFYPAGEGPILGRMSVPRHSRVSSAKFEFGDFRPPFRMLNLHSALFSHLVVCDSIGTSSDDSSFCIVYCRSVLSGSAKSVCGSGAGSGWGGVRSEAETERFLGTTRATLWYPQSSFVYYGVLLFLILQLLFSATKTTTTKKRV